MIDIHTHILHRLDDGPESLEESIEMCRMACRDGVKTVVATPHTLNGAYQNDRTTILSRVQELNEKLVECGMPNAEFGVENHPSSRKDLFSSAPCTRQSAMKKVLSFLSIRRPPSTIGGPSSIQSGFRSPHAAIEGSAFRAPHSTISFAVLPGADVSFSSDILRRFETGDVVTLNDTGRYILFEFPSQGIPYGAEEVLFQLMAKGLVPIISHPERNLEIARKPARYYEIIRRGCLGQVTAMSLTGGFGAGTRRVAEKLLANRLVHFIASDAHAVDRRPPVLSTAVKAAGKIVGMEEAWKMVTDYPEAVLDGRRPGVPDPKPIDKW